MKLLIINGPNIQLLGRRDPGTYGSTTLPQLEARLHEVAQELGVECTCFQSNHEHYIRQNNYCTDYTARAYIKINYNGKEYYRYSDVIERNIYNIAKQAMVSGLEAKSTLCPSSFAVLRLRV